jgi:hypothetical protein
LDFSHEFTEFYIVKAVAETTPNIVHPLVDIYECIVPDRLDRFAARPLTEYFICQLLSFGLESILVVSFLAPLIL